ncbi:MAG: hypothetical protein KDC98_09485 [Planctomycetes bacterium]|nr:hypothetical protein [Planctomycetota bacterium]
MRLHTIVAILLAPAVICAQATYVVDLANGPGTNFREIAAAAATVPSGSTLRVRAGSYAPATIDRKALTVLCDTGTSVAGLIVSNTAAGQAVVVRGLGVNGAVTISNALGLVHLDGNGATIVHWLPLMIFSSPQVSLRDYSVAALGSLFGSIACQVTDSTLVAENCVFAGGDGFPIPSQLCWGAAGAGILARLSEVILSHCRVQGGNGGAACGTTYPGAPAIDLDTSALRVVGSPGDLLAGGTNGAQQQSSLLGTGSARLDPRIPLTGTVPVGNGITWSAVTMADVRSTGAPPGGALAATWSGTAGNVIAIAVGFPGPPVHLPNLVDPIWIDLQHVHVVYAGTGPAAGLTVQVGVPNHPGLIGLAVLWQSAGLGVGSQLEVSNPSIAIVD